MTSTVLWRLHGYVWWLFAAECIIRMSCVCGSFGGIKTFNYFESKPSTAALRKGVIPIISNTFLLIKSGFKNAVSKKSNGPFSNALIIDNPSTHPSTVHVKIAFIVARKEIM